MHDHFTVVHDANITTSNSEYTIAYKTCQKIINISETIDATADIDLKARFHNYLMLKDRMPRTVEAYDKAVTKLLIWLYANEISSPTPEDVVAYREELRASGHAETTIRNYLTAVRLFFRFTEYAGIYPNVAKEVEGGKCDSPEKSYLTSGEVKTLLQSIDKGTLKGLRDYAMIALMVTCGLRDIEVSRADIGDIKPIGDSMGLYVQGKGKREKADFVKVDPIVERSINEYLTARGSRKEAEPLFTSTSNNNHNGRMTTRAISMMIRDRLHDAGLVRPNLTAHSLRHTFVTLSLLADKDITEVQQAARHANVATTLIYAHHLDKAKNTCSAAVCKAIF